MPTAQHLEFHPLDVELEQVQARQRQAVERLHRDRTAVLGRIGDRLADVLPVGALLQLQTAKAGGHAVIRPWYRQLAGFAAQRNQPRPGIETIIQGNLTSVVVWGRKNTDVMLLVREIEDSHWEVIISQGSAKTEYILNS